LNHSGATVNTRDVSGDPEPAEGHGVTDIDGRDGPAMLAAARALAPQLDRRAREAERLGTLPADLVTELRAAGMFRLATPRMFGGLELSPAEIIAIGAELSGADGSTGWTVLVGNGAAFLAWLDPGVVGDLVGPAGDVIAAAVFAPEGTLTPAGADRFRLSGRWPFSSGCRHADWFLNGALVHDGAAPRIVPGLGPDWRLAVFPAGRATVVDNWDVAGLRGTGSHDVLARDVELGAECTVSPFRQPARHDGPLWRLPFFTLVGVFLAGFPLGVARRALDELAELVRTRTRPPDPTPIAHEADLQWELAQAEGGVQAARAFVLDTVGALWEAALRGDVPSADARARFQLAAQQAMRAALFAVDVALRRAGSAALRLDSPIQRCFRDVHAAANHVYFSPAYTKRYARQRLGLDSTGFWF
jgi:alkylation response protein AidB-like acyl-CoA dehydrogenase